MTNSCKLLLITLLVMLSGQTRAAVISQVVEIDELGPSDELRYLRLDFDPFDPTLGTLEEVSIYFDARVDILLDQFICSLGPERCTIEFISQSIFETGLGVANQLGGRYFRPREYSGWELGDVSVIREAVSAGFPGLGIGPVEGFLAEPLRYQLFSSWSCVECDAIADPLLLDFQFYGEVRYEYTPSAVSMPSSTVLMLLALFAWRMSVNRIVNSPGHVRRSADQYSR